MPSIHGVFINFYMQLFFFISGFFVFKETPLKTMSQCLSLIKKRFVQLIIPPLFWGFLYAYITNRGIYDMLLIDEPESSFDNIFLKERVNRIIKEISQSMPVVIVTHNSTVGASIHPDFVIHTVRTVDGREAHYDIFFGEPGNKELINCNGLTISNLEAIMNCPWVYFIKVPFCRKTGISYSLLVCRSPCTFW